LAATRGRVANDHDGACVPGSRDDPADTGDGSRGMRGHEGVRLDRPRPVGEDERVCLGLADVLVHRLFAVGLDLHSALTCIESGIGGDVTAERIHRAISGLDGAIRDFRGVVLDLHPEGSAARTGLRSLIVEAVELACGPAGARPAITLGHGLEAVADRAVWQRAARLVHQTLALVPRELLSDAHVAVAADPRPPKRLVMHIDAPAGALAGVAGRLRALDTGGQDADRMNVSCQDVPRSPEHARIRLEWRMAAS
jgi:hypothetical protein